MSQSKRVYNSQALREEWIIYIHCSCNRHVTSEERRDRGTKNKEKGHLSLLYGKLKIESMRSPRHVERNRETDSRAKKRLEAT